MNSDLIIAAIGTIIVVGSWIANQVKENRQKASQQQTTLDRGDATPAEGGRRRLDQLAAQRRAELQRQAQARRDRYDQQRSAPSGTRVPPRDSMSGTGAAPGQREPSNLTMAERIARARAKAQYEQRSQSLGQSRETPARPEPAPPAAPPPRRGDPDQAQRRQAERQRLRQEQLAQRRREQEAAKQQQQRERAQREQAQRQQRAQQASRAPQPQRQAAATPQRRSLSSRPQRQAPPPATRRDVAATELGTGRAAPSQRRRLAAAAAPLAITPTTGGLMFDRASLRRAVVMKEVLDKPVALRDPLAEIG